MSDSRRLFLLGFLTLFLELVCIRFLAGNIWNLGYFPNLVLISVFVGMGIGFAGHRFLEERRSALTFAAAPAVLLALLLFVALCRPGVPGFSSTAGEFGGELFFTTADSSVWSSNTKGFANGDVVEPVRLFRLCPASSLPFPPTRGGTFMRAFDTHDGQRFVAACTVEPPGRFSVLLNWPFKTSGGS